MRLAPTVGRPTSRLSLTIGRMNPSVRQTSRCHADLPRDRHRRCTIRPSRRQRRCTTCSTVVRQLPRNRQQFHRPRSARSAKLPNGRAQWDDRRPASCFPVASARRNAGSLTDTNGNRQLDRLHKYPSLSVQPVTAGIAAASRCGRLAGADIRISDLEPHPIRTANLQARSRQSPKKTKYYFEPNSPLNNGRVVIGALGRLPQRLIQVSAHDSNSEEIGLF